MRDGRLERDLEALAALADPTRRALYLHVARAGGDVGRDEAAAAVGVTRSLAAFHLDRLVDEGLLEAGYRRLSGRTGPGAGRPAKVYRRKADIDVQIPERDYRLAGELLLESARRAGAPVGSKEASGARDRGVELGTEARAGLRGRRTQRALTEALVRALRDRGFDPRTSSEGVELRNCPFDALAADDPEIMCSLNRAFLDGVVEGLGAGHLAAVPVTRNGGCCVAIRPARR